MALFLVMAVMLSLVPSAFAAQEDNYHDPAEHWIEALNRTNELDANSTVTIETFNCCECGQATSFQVFRVPEYTRNGETALTRNVKYSDGTCLDGESKGDLLDGTPGKDAYYTGYHWTKAVCETCGTFNTNMGATNYSCDKNIYWLYDCAANFFEELPITESIEQVDSSYHRVTTTSGEYCGFCFGTFKETSSELVRHNMESAIRPELAHDRFVEMDTCAACGYSETAYTAAKSVVADYFGVVDGQPHTVTVSDLSDAGVTTAIRYGNEANSCTLTSAPNYTEAGDYPVYYEITYTYHDTDMVEDGVAFVHLRDETVAEDGSCSCGCGNPDCGCQDPDCDGCCCEDKGCGENHNWTLLDSVDPTCLTLGYDRYLCVECGMIEKRDYPYVWGGSSPATSFDCSGYLSWVLNQCGWNVGRLGATGLYNYCTPTSDPQPGDLVFFVGTYDTDGVSHCGLYLGDGMMLHCGDPIGYANLNTNYWQSHLLGYGRLP